MGVLQFSGREHTSLHQLLCPSFMGALWNLSYLVYVLLLAYCIFGSMFPPEKTEKTVLITTVRFVVQFWSLCLLMLLCRTRCAGVAGKLSAAAAAFARQGGGVGGIGPPGHRLQRGKATNNGRGDWFTFTSCEMQGWRPQMEDAVVCAPHMDQTQAESPSLFAVFDGHGGKEVSARVAEQVVARVLPILAAAESPGEGLRRAVLEIEEDLRRANLNGRWNLMGCTAAVAMLTRTSVTVASVGDSRVFKCRGGKCVQLTRDHKPESPRERRRIEAAGGTVAKFGPCWRIDFCLNMSRALGDFQFKDSALLPEHQKISPVPDVTVCEIDEQDEFLVVACDGLFELMTWESVCDYIYQRLGQMPLSQIAEGLLDACCSPNMMATGGRGTDNESVIIVALPGAKLEVAQAAGACASDRLLSSAPVLTT